MDEKRFEALVDRSEEHHRWLGAVNPVRLTGRLKVAGRQVTAHRYAWELVHGPVPPGARVLACADVPACVRLDHLRVEGAGVARRAARAPKGAGSLRRVRPGVWKLAVTAPAGVDGSRRVHRTVHAKDAKDAAAQLTAFAAEVRSSGGPSRESSTLRVDEAVERFLTRAPPR